MKIVQIFKIFNFTSSQIAIRLYLFFSLSLPLQQKIDHLLFSTLFEAPDGQLLYRSAAHPHLLLRSCRSSSLQPKYLEQLEKRNKSEYLSVSVYFVNSSHSINMQEYMSFTMNGHTTNLFLHDSRVDLTHVTSLIFFMHLFDDQTPRSLFVMSYFDSVIMRDDFFMQGQNCLVT